MAKAAGGRGADDVADGRHLPIYKEGDGGAPVWTETESVTPDTHGQYVLLGVLQTQDYPLTSRRDAGWACRCSNNLSRALLVSVPYGSKLMKPER